VGIVFEDRMRLIIERVEALRQRPGTADWFGANKHQFRFDPPLPEAEAAAFEKLHSISLPEDYRQFLLLAGNGGAGPYYGIDPLSQWDYWFDQEDDCPALLASPCPFAYEQVINQEWRDYLPPGREEWFRGSIHICDQGCAFESRLIVTGTSRGRIFNLDAHCIKPPHFVKDANFIDWYERWLDQALTGEPRPWFGYDNPAHSTAGS
jgi:hypothetical protein